ncbi:MAG TPA: hypothetical protein VGG15_10465 [Terriglobales bacterium]
MIAKAAAFEGRVQNRASPAHNSARVGESGTALVTVHGSSALRQRLYHRSVGYDAHILSYRNSTQLG